MKIKYTTDQRGRDKKGVNLVFAKKKKKKNQGARPTAASPGSPITMDNGPVVLPCPKKPCCLEPGGYSLSFSISFLETQFIGNTSRSPGGKQKAGSKMKHLINRENCSTIAENFLQDSWLLEERS